MMLTGKMFSTPKNGLVQKHDAILLSSCISVLSHIYINTIHILIYILYIHNLLYINIVYT